LVIDFCFFFRAFIVDIRVRRIFAVLRLLGFIDLSNEVTEPALALVGAEMLLAKVAYSS